jgi:O-antigen/teichoic acid export membrane protein
MSSKTHSLGLNSILNIIRTVLTMLFPVMTFWRISRIFTVETVGMYNFANATAGYFIMFAALGISAYAIREGAAFRDYTQRISVFSSEVFTINLISTLAAYIFLAAGILIVPQFYECRALLMILSVNMILMTVGCDWIHAIYEDFLYITVRTIAVYALALGLFFLLVNTPDDLYTYAWITVLATSGAQLLNIPARRKYCSVRPVPPKRAQQHLRPILTLFANTVTTSLYVNSDQLILGFLRGDYELGLYSAAVKIYMLFKSLLGAVIIAVTPRLSSLWANDREAFESTASRIFQTILTLLVPVAVGLFFLSEPVVLIIADAQYLGGIPALRWLCASLVLSIAGWFMTSCILIPAKEEKAILRITVIAALANIILNFVLIPLWGFTAAAITTVIAEGISCVLGLRKAGKLISVRSMISRSTIISILAGSALVAAICLWTNTWTISPLGKTLAAFGISIPVYAAAIRLLKNPAAMEATKAIRKVLHL